ncbi:hypothetical protein RvY_13082-4 [Ramazzottius varieornatus]|uniref:Uncharacterized protein n=1 Tax=Ramazzottius varieornatus TaxID=947166 RepID=A0A1D1VLN9_RAMVA|nr:hypothetical protein RvY_13082-4 [Ramazzottius varieornatus]
MLVASDLGFTAGEHVYLGVNLFPSTTWGNFSYSTGDDRDDDARDAYQSLLLISLSVSQDTTYSNFVQQTKKLSAAKYGFVYAPNDEVDVITAHFYDSIIYYASMIRDLAEDDSPSFSGAALALLKQSFNFTSPINGPVTMSADGDRQSAYTIKNFNPISGQFERTT